MIDENKITEAVNAYIGFPKELGEGLETSMRRDAFRDGVEWFKKALWHDASEMPEKGKAFIFLAVKNSSKHYHVRVLKKHGTDLWNGKFNKEQVVDIIKQHQNGASCYELGRKYGCGALPYQRFVEV